MRNPRYLKPIRVLGAALVATGVLCSATAVQAAPVKSFSRALMRLTAPNAFGPRMIVSSSRASGTDSTRQSVSTRADN